MNTRKREFGTKDSSFRLYWSESEVTPDVFLTCNAIYTYLSFLIFFSPVPGFWFSPWPANCFTQLSSAIEQYLVIWWAMYGLGAWFAWFETLWYHSLSYYPPCVTAIDLIQDFFSCHQLWNADISQPGFLPWKMLKKMLLIFWDHNSSSWQFFCRFDPNSLCVMRLIFYL